MKSIVIFMLCIVPAVWAQGPAAMTPETVVARIDGKPVTAGELMLVLQMSPPEAQKNLLKDSKMFLESFGLIRKLAEMAEKAHLDQQSPLKEQLEISRRQYLASAQASAARDSVIIHAAEQKKFYEDHLDRYTQAKVKVLFVSFRANPAPQTNPKAKKILSEPEAKAKIEKLLGQIRAGADFVKLVKENSDDSDSVARDGDFGPLIRRSDDSLPADIKNAIFALKPGKITDPLRVPSGFYLFRLEESTVQTYDAVRDDIFIEIQQKRFNEWQAQMVKSLDVKIVNENFFSKTAASATSPK
jgi:peptidyl-prolyl cis-trans isomerase C